MRWLALDVGSRRVGCAVSDAGERIATRLPALPFAGAGALAEAVARLAREREVGGLVVGRPVTRGGTSRGERRVEGVVEALRARLDIPVELADERGSTVEAEAVLRRMGVPPRRWADLVDGIAAAIVLESFLAGRQRDDHAGDGPAVDLDSGGC